MERFLRSKLLLGEDKIDLLSKSKVAIVGLGAVGSYVAEGLARAGIGNFIIIDFDNVEKSNINRQLYALESTLGIAKVNLAKKRILDINPKVKIVAHNLFLKEELLYEILPVDIDYVVDAIDSLNPKVDLLEFLFQNNISHISSMGAARRKDPFAIKIGNLFESKYCPLARFVRKRLRRRGIRGGITAIFSEEQKNNNCFELANNEQKNNYPKGRYRTPLGSLPTVTGIFGLLIANHVIMQITGE